MQWKQYTELYFILQLLIHFNPHGPVCSWERCKKTLLFLLEVLHLAESKRNCNIFSMGLYGLKSTDTCSACKCSKPTDLFFCALSTYTSARVSYCMSRYLLVTPVDQLRRQLGVRCYSKWYYIWPGVDVLARNSRSALNLYSKQITLLFQ